ncbi:hypothetical protein NC99_39740 [Sunxiuqinia dokdonensis]|uniref:Uncharacterized protein n=1 Tax=Sunxiuqinia dokdonensis TaxID=1409788 RepID=A0A0L8V4H0_9BACT|nr:hypothetical protein NC99_39740 [Sunxiuqinia dokdonensis]
MPDSGWGFRKIIRGLQLRVQLRILTGFPFDPDLAVAGSLEPNP